MTESFQQRDGFARVASQIENFQEADKQGFWDTKVVSIKCGVRTRSLAKFLGIYELTDYSLSFSTLFLS